MKEIVAAQILSFALQLFTYGYRVGIPILRVYPKQI